MFEDLRGLLSNLSRECQTVSCGRSWPETEHDLHRLVFVQSLEVASPSSDGTLTAVAARSET